MPKKRTVELFWDSYNEGTYRNGEDRRKYKIDRLVDKKLRAKERRDANSND